MISPEAADRYVLAVDHGTSAVKTSLISTRGEILATRSRSTPVHHLPDGGVEQDPQDWWRALVGTCRELVEQDLIPRDKIVAVCCSSTWSTAVAVDAHGMHLAPAMTWLDARGEPHVRRLMRGWINLNGYGLSNAIRWVPKTGGAPTLSGKDDIAHVLYWKHERPKLYDQTHMFLPAKDYLNARLTGRLVASPDSISLFWCTDTRDIRRVRYHPRLILKLGLDPAKLPPLEPAASLLGELLPEVAKEVGLNPGVQVAIGAPDLQAATIGSGAVGDFQGHLYVGTSSWITCHVPFKKTDIWHNLASLPAAVPGRYFVANEQDVAGGALSWLRDNLLMRQDDLSSSPAPDDAFSLFDRLAKTAPPGCDGLIFTPWLNGERTPVEDHLIRGGWFNLKLTSTRAQLVRSVFEGVAMNSRWVMGHVERFCGRSFHALNMIGGGGESAVWCQIFADVLNREIRQVVDPIQANARGAAFIASVALGLIAFEDVPDLVPIATTYRPDPDLRQLYDGSYRVFCQLYDANRPIHRRLNKGHPT